MARDEIRDPVHSPRRHDSADKQVSGTAIYADDMYVERSFSERTAASIRGLRPWLTNAYEHNGLRADAAVLERLMKMMHGEA